MEKKNIYIISGPNGSGKTTFAKEFLPDYANCPNFINADLIAQGLSPFSPQQVAIKAGKLVLEQITQFSEKGLDFGFETTLSGKTYLKHFKVFKKKGYRLNLFFLWIPSPQLSIVRIQDRVKQGGHDVPIADIKRRFDRSIEKFFKEYRLLADKWILFNNSGEKPKIIAKKQNAHIDIIDRELMTKITKKAGVKL
ncbi:MAG: zeta toxin family protein [Candidatus Omnitrophica bacterium]|nr:zeta toxin family protein [Candidatus Omnitrophota bacterium]MDD5430393.1 zeta toxin family protein [Candidatus Omnitrophota bacterium]